MNAFKFQWVPHNGGAMPVSADTLVDVRLGDGELLEGYPARDYTWHLHPDYLDIVAYRVVEVRE